MPDIWPRPGRPSRSIRLAHPSFSNLHSLGMKEVRREARKASCWRICIAACLAGAVAAGRLRWGLFISNILHLFHLCGTGPLVLSGNKSEKAWPAQEKRPPGRRQSLMQRTRGQFSRWHCSPQYLATLQREQVLMCSSQLAQRIFLLARPYWYAWGRSEIRQFIRLGSLSL